MHEAAEEEGPHHDRIGEARGRIEEEIARLRRDHDLLRRGTGRQDAAGDRADEAEALEESDELTRLTDRITELTEQLDHLDSVRAGHHRDSDELVDGTRVTVRYADATIETMDAVAVTEESAGTDAGLLTLDSPLGRALSGARAGDTVEYSAPAGPTQVHVLAVRPPRTSSA